MATGKFRLTPNMIKKSTLFVTVCGLLLMFSLVGFAFSSAP